MYLVVLFVELYIYILNQKDRRKMCLLTIRIATKHANVVFQSPYDDALPTSTL